MNKKLINFIECSYTYCTSNTATKINTIFMKTIIHVLAVEKYCFDGNGNWPVKRALVPFGGNV